MIRKTLMGLVVGLCLIGAICLMMIWYMTREIESTASKDPYQSKPCGPECGYCHPTHLKPGDVDSNDNLVVYVNAGFHKVLETDYVFSYRNIGDEDQPIERFELFSRESGYEKFDTLEALMQRVERIPHPRILDFYSNCGAPLWWGIPQEKSTGMFNAMESANVELRESREGVVNFTCLCPCANAK